MRFSTNSPQTVKGDMSDNRSGEAGFMSTAAFDEACQALTPCPALRSSGMSAEVRRHVRLPGLLATFVTGPFPL